MDTIYYLLGYTQIDEIVPSEKTLSQRHLLLQQIKNSNLKLHTTTQYKKNNDIITLSENITKRYKKKCKKQNKRAVNRNIDYDIYD
jgi:hypothetical protein